MAFNSNWLSDWSKRVEITIDHTKIDDDLTDFPLLLNIRNSCGTNSADVMSGFKSELSISDYDFSDDFTGPERPWNDKKWRKNTPTGDVEVGIVNNKLTVSGTTAGTNMYQWFGSINRWYFRSTTLSVEAHQGYTPSETTSEDWLHYFIIRDVDNPANNAAEVQFYYNPSAHGAPTPLLYRSRVKDNGANDYGTSYYTNISSFKTKFDRSGSTMNVYADVGSGWVLLDSSSIPSWGDNTEVYCLLYNLDYSPSNTKVYLWLDQIKVNSGTVRHYYSLKKMALVDSNGTQCPIEIEDTQFRLNRAIMWTKVPSVSKDVDTKLYLYYDYTKDDNTDYVGELGDAVAMGVWDDDYVAVYHLENGGYNPSGSDSVEDSTDNLNHGTPNNTPNLVTAKAGRGLNFDPSSSEYVNLGGNLSELDGASELTVSFIMKSDEMPFTGYRGIFARGSSDRVPWVYGNSGASSISCQCYLNDASTISRTITGLSVDTWHALDFVWDGSDFYRYKDGDSAGSSVSTSSSTLKNSNGYNYIAYMQGYTYFDGILDEIRISTTARSAAYIKASYYSSWDNLVSYGPEHNYPPSVISGTLYDKYSRTMNAVCKVIVSDLDGQFVVSDVTAANGKFEISVPAAPDERFIVTFYKEGKYGLDYDIAGAKFMTPVATTSG
jgi:hypothetical protein